MEKRSRTDWLEDIEDDDEEYYPLDDMSDIDSDDESLAYDSDSDDPPDDDPHDNLGDFPNVELLHDVEFDADDADPADPVDGGEAMDPPMIIEDDSSINT